MLVGAGLMFVLMHGEVKADGEPEPFVCSEFATMIDGGELVTDFGVVHCRVGNIACGVGNSISCVNIKSGLF